ncbi:caspase family protein [Pseudomonas vranovensis]|uniref:Peptidase C14 caspase domain-containing protein n=1 Tax=Pseudomonas vranovensis TaxID=321661 RepID=A0A423DU67_9PSED|nr:caspase family protein [Pseudomonas vranovensis]ROL75573.1 hypothetical protein BHU25_09230 [Pseudomonas vranovensis]
MLRIPLQPLILLLVLPTLNTYVPGSTAAECSSDSRYEFNTPTQEAVAGKPVTVVWQRTIDNSTEQAETLVLQTSEQARFGPGDYLALRHPVKNSEGSGWVSRVLIPVVKGHNASGSVEIIPLQAGRLDIYWSTASTHNCVLPLSADNLFSINVLPGPPKLYVDPPDRSQPQRMEAAKGAPYILEVHDGYYKVFNSVSGELVLSKTGVEPVFSPSGRFLTSKLPGNDLLQLFDLSVPREIFLSNAAIVAFSHHDSFALVVGGDSGSWLVRTLQDGSSSNASVTNVQEEDAQSETPSKQPSEPLELLPGQSFAGSDGFFTDQHELFLSLTSRLVAYRESATSGPDGSTSYQATEPLVFDLISRQPIAQNDARFDTAVKQLLQSDRDNEITSWSSDGDLAVTWIADDRYLPLTVTSTTVSTQVAAHVQSLRGQLKGFTDDGMPLIRDIATALSELDGNVQFSGSRALLSFVTSGNPKRAREIERELQGFYDKKRLLFERIEDNGYEAAKLPDPLSTAAENDITEADLSNQGQRFWRWNVGGRRYWLQQSAQAGRRGGTTSLVLLSSEGTQLRYVDFEERASEENKTFDSAYVLGDGRFQLNEINQPAAVSLIGDQYLAISPKPSDSLLIFDLKSWGIYCSIAVTEGSNLTQKIDLVKSKPILLQERSDNTFSFYDCANEQGILHGQFVNGEVVLTNPDGFYDGPVEATEMLRAKSAGLAGTLYLSQFEGKFKVPGLLAKSINAQKIDPVTLAPPPVLITTQAPSRTGDLISLRATGSVPLSLLRIVGDGRILQNTTLQGRDETVNLDLNSFPSHPQLTAVAFDQNGLTSSPLTINNPLAKGASKGKLIAFALGVNAYQDARLPTLSYGVSDARRVLAALNHAQGYASLEIAQPFDQNSSKEQVLARIQEAVSKAGDNDTLFFSFSGHGLKSQSGTLALATTDTNLDAINETALLWSDVAAALSPAKARIVILLDACHAGLADPKFAASNDLAADRLTSQSGASIIIFSAAKGRQFSEEAREVKGGVFSVAFADIVSRNRKQFDLNADSQIQMSELSRALKAQVGNMTDQRQSPWLSRNEMFGDFPLF